MNRYLLIGLSVFCIFMMLLSSFSDKVGGPFKVVANVTVIPLQQGINQIGGCVVKVSMEANCPITPVENATMRWPLSRSGSS